MIDVCQHDPILFDPPRWRQRTDFMRGYMLGNLDGVSPEMLAGARRALHLAAQVIASVGAAFTTADTGSRQSNFLWRDGGQMIGREVGQGHRVLLDVLRLELVLRDEHAATDLERFVLVGKSVEDALEWLAAQLESLGYERPVFGELSHEAELGVAWREEAIQPVPRGELEVLASWFQLARIAVGEVASDHEDEASSLRGCPRRLNLMTRISLDRREADSASRQIEVGFSPGTSALAEPHFYVKPSPTLAPASQMSVLPDGAWRDEGGLEAILSCVALVKEPAQERMGIVRRFLSHAVGSSSELLAG